MAQYLAAGMPRARRVSYRVDQKPGENLGSYSPKRKRSMMVRGLLNK